MSTLEAIILGFVQGLTEFLPISSSGHLVLFQKLLGIKGPVLTFDVLLHVGTLFAVVVVFWQDILSILKKPFQKLTFLLIVATIPTGIIGVALKDFFDRIFASGQTIGVEFIITGLIIYFADKARNTNKDMDSISYVDALFVGFMQGIAIFPAISRSGLTIAGSLFRGIKREDAARFSFLVSLPAIAGATLLDAKDILKQPMALGGDALPMIVGTLVAAISGYFAVKYMMQILRTGSMKVFSYYVWALGAVIIVLQLLGKW